MPLRKEVDLEKTVAAASGVFRDVCSEEPPYHTAEELWEGLKQGDEGARLLFVFFLRLRKNERTRCSVEKAIAAEGKRWVGVLIEEAWRLYLLMRHRAVPYQGKPKSVVAVEGSRAQRRILARSGLARYSAPSLKEKAAVRLQTTWDTIYQQWVVLWMDNWYNKQFTTNPDKNDKSLNATALAVLLLKDAPRYWHGHPSLEDLERRVPIVARMLGNTEGTFPRILQDLGFASTRPVVRNIRAPLDIIRPVPAKRPHWRPLCLSKEKVSGNVSLLNLLQFTRDLAQHSRPVVPVLCDENIHYRICKMMYGEKTTGWNVRLFLRSHPILYGFWHAYKFCVTQTFRSFWPIVTFFRKGLLRSGDTVPCFPKLITMEITVGALLLGMGPHIRRLNRKCRSLELARPANRRSRLRYDVCKAMQVLLTQYCPMLLYLGHLVRQCNWAGETANTGVFASEGLQIVMCLLDRLNMGDTLLKYERTVATALLCHTAWHTAMPGQAFAEEFCESLLSSLVTKKGQNRGAVTIEDVDDLYQLITIRKEGHRVNVCKIPNSFVNSVRQRLTAYLNAERVYVPWVRWCAEPTCAIQAHWPRRGVPNFPPSLLIPKGSNHYKQVLVSVLLVLTQQGPLKAGFKRKLSELIPQRSVLEEQREANTLRNVRRRLENMQ